VRQGGRWPRPEAAPLLPRGAYTYWLGAAANLSLQLWEQK